jgi:hypothetical protein
MIRRVQIEDSMERGQWFNTIIGEDEAETMCEFDYRSNLMRGICRVRLVHDLEVIEVRNGCCH